MASAALESHLPASPDGPPWLSPRISFSFDLPEDAAGGTGAGEATARLSPPATPDFEFPSLPLPLPPSDDLISGGKLLPLHLPSSPPPPPPPSSPPAPSPKAPRCSARIRDILRLRRDAVVRRLLPRRKPDDASKDSSSAPLLRQPDPAPPRLSLDSDRNGKPSSARAPPRRIPAAPETPRAGRGPARTSSAAARGSSVDSPRMNSSGRVVFQSLERSSSSPGSFHGGPRPKPRPIERSYSANVRVSPVINVFGFAPVFSSSASRGKRRGGKPETT